MHLTPNFLSELFKLMYLKENILTICAKHLKYSHIPKEFPEFKAILKSILTQYENSGKLPTIGVTSQQFADKIDIQDAISEIKKAEIQDHDQIINELEKFIKNIEFQALNEKVVELFTKGEQEDAIEFNAEESKRIAEISLRKDSGDFIKVFGDFHKENKDRVSESEEKVTQKVPFYIDPIDDITFGGIDVTDTALWIMRSGIGKSTALKWTGLRAAVDGYNVLHFQLEGSKSEARDKYTQIFTKLKYNQVRKGDIDKSAMKKIDKLLKQMEDRGRDVFVYSFEKFGEPTMVDIREIILEYHKIKGVFPDLIVIDSLDLLTTGTHTKIDKDPNFNKQKLQKVAQLMKNIAGEFKTRILTATQTGNIPPTIWDDADKVIDRSMTEGDRTLVKPFSYVLTGNQTRDEQKRKVMRLFVDKLRNYNPKDQTYPICTDFETGAFYHSANTKKRFYSTDSKDL